MCIQVVWACAGCVSPQDGLITAAKAPCTPIVSPILRRRTPHRADVWEALRAFRRETGWLKAGDCVHIFNATTKTVEGLAEDAARPGDVREQRHR